MSRPVAVYRVPEPLPADLRGIVASYPRSGLHWLRYCIEHFSGRPTPGRPLLHSAGPCIVDRSHDLKGEHWWGPTPWPTLYDGDGRPRYARLILLLRNYKEGLACEGREDLLLMRSYVANVEAFHGFAGAKLLVHYEDLMTDFAGMERILDFLDLPYTLDGFDPAYHRARSQLIYHARRTAYTRHAPLDFNHHSRRLDPDLRRDADAWFEERLGADLYRRYLGRYHESVLNPP